MPAFPSVLEATHHVSADAASASSEVSSRDDHHSIPTIAIVFASLGAFAAAVIFISLLLLWVSRRREAKNRGAPTIFITGSGSPGVPTKQWKKAAQRLSDDDDMGEKGTKQTLGAGLAPPRTHSRRQSGSGRKLPVTMARLQVPDPVQGHRTRVVSGSFRQYSPEPILPRASQSPSPPKTPPEGLNGPAPPYNPNTYGVSESASIPSFFMSSYSRSDSSPKSSPPPMSPRTHVRKVSRSSSTKSSSSRPSTPVRTSTPVSPPAKVRTAVNKERTRNLTNGSTQGVLVAQIEDLRMQVEALTRVHEEQMSGPPGYGQV